MHFSCIYCGRESFAELYEFTEEVLKIAKEFFLPPKPLQTRVCGLYFLYGLYYKQPTIEDGEYLVKIRLNFKEWQDSYSLMAVLREEQHYDALFIFSKLLTENAFHFCAMPREYGLERSIRKYLERDDTGLDEDLPPRSEVLMLEESGLLSSLDELSKKYFKLKCGLNNASNRDKPHQLLNYANSAVADDIRKVMLTMSGGTSYHKDENDTQKSIGSHRKKLKDQACYGAGPSKVT
ncbi:snRNA-activating protein complex subunit 1 isoform X2 [Zootermopsis nevadensis]|nr:snRNA-activating protein complex subunit 1 isoform X2 [Zootermopsis nevadensis]XP_021915771.1 snRNA-activating protein complex subunit 1 isoform X2 [Zootermopsis nevadensis]